MWSIGLLGYIEIEMNICQFDNWINSHEKFYLKLIILFMMNPCMRTLTPAGINRLFREY